MLVSLGIDLAGVSTRPTGVCILRGMSAQTQLLFTDDDLLDLALHIQPNVVAIDAPLSLPPGRTSIDDDNGVHFRICDEELKQRGIRFFPITLGPMRVLTQRGMALRRRFEASSLCVIEIYPGGAQDVWGIPRVRHSLSGLRQGLARLGVKGLHAQMRDHELDAVTGALVGRLFLQHRAEVYGHWEEGAIVMPKRTVDNDC